ncbi:Ribulose-phosphate 3-epimerase [Peribacillus simplex]|uniref:ribulose-phosphate 3-epimerase n=1 Tax=Peribacillus simplex TaxID=1478 RepID=UPI001DFE0E88|nr:ribulose-phosphate 3-epimerase [Peribacillus simplex]CAH0303072.1 Ribulose-phosphate 3-epimerase [Peribacillus simplex]
MIKIAPSVFGADISNLKSQLDILKDNEINMLHVDMMDGNFVPNIAFGPDQIHMLRKSTNLTLDIHMMVSDPDRYIPRVAEAGADIITIHQEATNHLQRSIQLIKDHGKKVGVALNPATSLDTLKYVLEEIDMVLIMTVNPGLGGQKFMPSMLKKIKDTKEMVRNYSIDIEVDGGVNDEIAAKCIDLGANVIVVGSYTFNGEIKENIVRLQEITRLKG